MPDRRTYSVVVTYEVTLDSEAVGESFGDGTREAFDGPAGTTIALAKCAEMVALNVAASGIQEGLHRA